MEEPEEDEPEEEPEEEEPEEEEEMEEPQEGVDKDGNPYVMPPTQAPTQNPAQSQANPTAGLGIMQSPASLPHPTVPALPVPAQKPPFQVVLPGPSIGSHGLQLGDPTPMPKTTKPPKDPTINPNSTTGPQDEEGEDGEEVNVRGDAKGPSSGGGGAGIRVSRVFFLSRFLKILNRLS